MMSTKKYRIRLTTDEQQELNALVSRGRAAAYKQTHVRWTPKFGQVAKRESRS